jgi:hypothetical protein
MMKEEFEKRIGLVISQEEYEGIEAAYMGLPESVGKDKFSKLWVKEGGIQDLFDKRLARVRTLTGYVNDLEERANERIEWIKKLEGDLAECGKEIKNLRSKLAVIAANATEALG